MGKLPNINMEQLLIEIPHFDIEHLKEIAEQGYFYVYSETGIGKSARKKIKIYKKYLNQLREYTNSYDSKLKEEIRTLLTKQ